MHCRFTGFFRRGLRSRGTISPTIKTKYFDPRSGQCRISRWMKINYFCSLLYSLLPLTRHSTTKSSPKLDNHFVLLVLNPVSFIKRSPVPGSFLYLFRGLPVGVSVYVQKEGSFFFFFGMDPLSFFRKTTGRLWYGRLLPSLTKTTLL